MPRDNDTDLEKGSDAVLRFTGRIDCPTCGTEFEGEWTDTSIDIEQLTDPPVGPQTCPACGWAFVAEFTGWTMYSDGTG